MLPVCCWDLPVLCSFAALLIWTQAVTIDWESPSGYIFSLNCMNEVCRIFPKDFVWDLPNPWLVLVFSSPWLSPPSFMLPKGSGSCLLPVLEWGGLCLQSRQSICVLANTPQSITAQAKIFLKPLFTWGPEKPRCSLSSEKSGMTYATLSCGTYRRGVPTPPAWARAPALSRSQGCASFTNHSGESNLDPSETATVVGMQLGMLQHLPTYERQAQAAQSHPGFLHRAARDVLR